MKDPANAEQNCVFCKIVAGELPSKTVYSDDRILAFYDLHPKSDVHVLVIPRQHIDSLDHLREDDQPLVGYLIAQLPTIAKQLGLEAGFRTVINTGPAGGQVVYHLHAHIMGGQRIGNIFER